MTRTVATPRIPRNSPFLSRLHSGAARLTALLLLACSWTGAGCTGLPSLGRQPSTSPAVRAPGSDAPASAVPVTTFHSSRGTGAQLPQATDEGTVILTDHTTDHSPLAAHPGTDPAVTVCPNEPRVPLHCDPRSSIFGSRSSLFDPQTFAGTQTPPLPLIDPHPDDIADEFLCDGGDRALPVHYDRYNRLGLDTQDTIAEYIDDEGEWHVRPSNEVCLYAPRFGQVRSLSSASEDIQVVKLGATLERTGGIALGQQTVSVIATQPEAIGSIHVRSRASGLETESAPVGVEQPLAAVSFDRPQATFQNITFFVTGRLVETEEPFLAATVQAAIEWTRDEFPVVMASTAAGEELLVSFTGAEIIGIDDRKAPGDLRIVKAADRTTALPGDVVTFTLRYDNIGERDLYQIRVVDNLTPRLAYVEGSGTSDRPGDINVQDNGEGSSVLTFELDDPLPGKTGGTITFQARVR